MAQSPYASDTANTELYVKVKYSGIQPLVVAIDHMNITTFGTGKTPYLSVPAVIAWHEKEIEITKGKGGNAQTLEYLREALEGFESVRGQYGKREA